MSVNKMHKGQLRILQFHVGIPDVVRLYKVDINYRRAIANSSCSLVHNDALRI